MILALVALSTTIGTGCPSSLAEATTYNKFTHVHSGDDRLLDPRCRNQATSILEEAQQAGFNLDAINYAFIRQQLGELQSLCRVNASPIVRRKARVLVEEGHRLLSGDTVRFEPLPEIDEIFEKGRYRDGFIALSRIKLAPYIATFSHPAIAALNEGVRAGARGEFPAASRAFSAALRHASSAYPLPEALYMLGVSRMASGDVSGARATWCVGLPLTFLATPDSRANVNWNLLIANRLGHGETQPNPFTREK